jgi:ankyrin repeat protein
MGSELMRAVTSRDLAKIMECLKHKKFVKIINQPDIHGNTPLNYACALGLPEEIIAEMIKKGADVNIANKMGATPLTHAVYAKMPPNVLQMLVKAGADPNAKNEHGGTALQIACVCKAPLPIIQCLVELGADVDAKNNHGNTALMFAVRNHNEMEVVQYLAKLTKDIDHETTEDPKFPGYTALHFAAAEHQPAHAALLIKAGASLDIENLDGHTPLFYADENTKLAMMSSLHARESGL